MKVSIGEIHLGLTGNLLIKEFEIDDRRGNAMVAIKNLNLKPGAINRKNKVVTIKQLNLEGVEFALRKYSTNDVSNLGYFIQHFSSRETDTLKPGNTGTPWIIVCNGINIRNSHFYYQDVSLKQKSPAIDYNDIELIDMDILTKKVRFDGDTIYADIQNIAFIEKSGFELKEFSGNIKFSPYGIWANHLKIITNYSQLDLDLRFGYKDFNAFSNFIEEVDFDAHIRPSELQMNDIGYFAEPMFSMTDLIKIEGDYSGTVDNISGKNMVASYGEATKFVGSVRMNGLPDITETFINANITELQTKVSDVRAFALPDSADRIPVPELLVKMDVVNINGKFTGFYNDFVSKATVKSKLGKLNTDIVLKTNKNDKSLSYRGTLIASSLNVGKLFSMEPTLGKTNFVLKVDGKGVRADSLEITAKGTVQSLVFNDYKYNNISVDGNLRKQVFEGHAGIKDENLDFDFDGLIDFNEDKPRFDFHSKINYADLFNLKLSNRDSVSQIATSMKFDFFATSIDDIRGSVIFDSTTYTEGVDSYFLNHLKLEATQENDGQNGVKLTSDFVDMNLEGFYTVSGIIPSIKYYLQNYSQVLANKFSSKPGAYSSQFIDFNINLKKTDDITNLFIPELKIAPNASISGVINLAEKKVEIGGSSPWINYSTLKMKDWFLKTDSDADNFELQTGFGKVLLKDISASDSIGIGADSLLIQTRLMNDTVNFEITWNDLSNQQKNTGDVAGFVQLAPNNKLAAGFTSVELLIDSASWTIKPENRIISDKNGLFFSDLDFYSDTSLFSVAGGISKNYSDSLRLGFEKLNISHIDQFLRQGNIDINGILTGKITLVNLYSNPNFLADISIDDLYFNGEDLGILKLKTTWEDTLSRLGVNLDILRKGTTGINEIVSVKGDYYPAGIQRNFDLQVKLNNLATHIFNPFMDEFVILDDASLASGNLSVTGNYKQPVATGKISLMQTQFLIKYLNTKYSAAGSMDVGENFIKVNDLTLYDTKQNSASCTGTVNHDYFRDFSLDIHVKQDNFKALNTTSRDNQLFYGTAVASGTVDIVGPFDDILMNIQARTDDGTRIILPISSSLSVSENDFIIFLNDADTVTKKKEPYNTNMKGFSMNMELDVTPEANMEIFLPYNMGNIKGNGSGEIGMTVNPRGDFTINGDYVISDGTFFFNFENILGREFDIKKGSKISFTGDPYDATVDIMATYAVKTTLAGLRLQTDSSSIRNTRVEVNCNISLKNALFNPDIRFSIDFANVAEDTKQIIYAALDTTNQSDMSQQIISLLVIGSFSYTTAGPNIGATGFKLLSNQLSDWLSKISKDFDIGINYQPGTALTEDELEVALRTQLFNDRLSIDGNFGVRGTSQEQNTSNVVGDINVEYKITQDGRFRIKAFNRTNDISFLENNAPYTQGVGIFYKKEFETFRKLFRRENNRKKKDEIPEERSNQQAVRQEDKKLME